MRYASFAKIESKDLEHSAPNVSLLFDKYYPEIQDAGGSSNLPSAKGKNKSSNSNETLNRPLIEEISRLSGSAKKYLYPIKERILRNVIIPLEKSMGSENFFYLVGELKSNLAINLATRFENTGISLDRRTGVPVIWGSSIKGCCAHAAEPDDRLRIDTFGGDIECDSALKGKVDFFPAYMIGCEKQSPIEVEVITPHNDGGNPVPIFFPVVGAGAKFLFIAALNEYGLYNTIDGKLVETDKVFRKNILDYAKTTLKKVFELGIGAKTSSSFGWFEEDESAGKVFSDSLKNTQKNIAEAGMAEAAKQEFDRLSPIEQYRKRLEEAPTNGQGAGGEFLSNEAKALKNKTLEEQKVFIEVMQSTKKDTLKSWCKKKSEAYKVMLEVAQTLNIELKKN